MIIKKNISAKFYILFLALITFHYGISGQSNSLNETTTFNISGKINGLINDQWIWLQNADEEQTIIDSTKTINGEFQFKGSVNYPTLYRLNIGKSIRESYPFFVENSNISLKCDYIFPFSCEVKGSYNQQLVDEFAIIEKIAWNPEVIKNMKNTYLNYNDKAGAIRKKTFSETIASFSEKHPNDRAVAYLVSSNSNYILDNDLVNIYYNFGDKLKSSIFSKEILAEIEMRNATKIGKKLPNIKQYDLNQEKVSLWDFREKYLLLYFWASGYEPCRIENTKLLKVYNKYKDWGFDVMAVSMDSVAAEWHRAVMEDNLSWQNVSDLQGWNNSIATKLSIRAVPYTILIDREGTIIGKDLQAEEIDNILNLMKATNDAAGKNKMKTKKRKKVKSRAGALPGADN
jgi:peroxiredoxin